ncbi:Enoyl-CoA hydratase/carnithine racemase [Cohaesibacter sp. ES.047]|uniref:enoyl-CoA hydratase n=1 Tax=Cohaesibacter sp. ES.047 TaxID=1798205 RepID=UPI000BB7D803|nr:enoyl-CoA hydratase [Cohaesibacter sp. ES.047]SNY94186.1 Enoyl-CoA hydratase/carnithine racemase [Cohaesibacter sp. ES.047]
MTNTQTTDKILIERSGTIGRIIINNETRRNAMTLDMWQAIPAAVKQLDDDPAIHVIAFTGAGEKAFISGADISEFDTVRKDTASASRYDDINADCYRQIRNAKKPTIALIKGFCMGGGLGLAAACDLRLSNKSGKFGIPAGKLGVGYPLGAIGDIVTLAGSANAKALYLTANVYDADRAAAMGLLNEIFEDAEFDAKAQGYCETVATLAPLSAQYHKAAINSAIDQTDCLLADALREMGIACYDSADYAEGRKAFAEKRKPVFTGK